VLTPALELILGLALLYFGAEWLVKGAAGLARSFGVPALIVGLTVVGYGTSAPEMTVSVLAALRGSSELALGNVIGSNIANLGLILGLTALVAPPRTDGRLIRREMPLLLLTTAALPLLLRDGRIGRLEGGLLLGSAFAFTLWLIRDVRYARVDAAARVDTKTVEAAAEAAGAPGGEGRGSLALYALIGLALIVVGGEVFVRGAVSVARHFGVDDRTVGLTVVAIGTSLPELATSIVAARRGHSDLAVGNVVGSNLYNVLLVLGTTAVIHPVDGDAHAMRLDLVTLAAMTLFAAVAVRTERIVRRWEGAVLLLAYVGFLILLVVRR
jgi:cation:H+ antiporter